MLMFLVRAVIPNNTKHKIPPKIKNVEIKKYENEQWSKSGMSICGGVYRQYINIQGVYSSSNIALALAKIQYIHMKCVKQ